MRIYRPQGRCKDILTCQEEEVLAVGPAGTGKSLAALTKLYLRAEKYPKSRHLICRQTRKSCTDTCLVTWEDEVLPVGHPALRGGKRENRHSYLFPNGSEVVVGGLDDPAKLFSSQWDTVYVNEAIEVNVNSWETLGTRLRNGRTGYHQLLGDTNPGPPTHWLLARNKAGNLPFINTTHEDNGRYYDDKAGTLTEEGERYLAVLKKMTGARYTRLFLGEWSTPEGARWPMLDPQVHRFNWQAIWPQGIPAYYTRWVSIDHGYGAPYCALWHCADRQGNVYTYREDYGPGYTADVQVQRVRDIAPENEQYYAEYLDPSMWNQDSFARGKIAKEKTAAEIFEEGFKPDIRFGPVCPGTRVQRVVGFSTLDKMLNRDNEYPNWYIDYSCENLWKELVGAILKRNEVHDLWLEDLDPKCPDHAITSAIYGLHTHYEIPAEHRGGLEAYDPVRYREEREQERIDKSERDLGKIYRPVRRRIRY